jgi:hypothetical protein
MMCIFCADIRGNYEPSCPSFLRAKRTDASQPGQQMSEKIATRAELLGYAPGKLNR